MPLKPLYQFKVNELFLQWISQPETQKFLLMNLKYISRDKVPTPIQRKPYAKFLRKISQENFNNCKKKKKVRNNIENSTTTISNNIESQPNSEKLNKLKKSVEISDNLITPEKTDNETMKESRTYQEYDELEMTIFKIFDAQKNKKIKIDDFNKIIKICQLPFYIRRPMFEIIAKGKDSVSFKDFIELWRRLEPFHEEKYKLIFKILSENTDSIRPDLLGSIIQDVVDTHPKLRHLKGSIEFHKVYKETVLERIYMGVTRTRRKVITLAEAKAAKLAEDIENLSIDLPSYFDYKDFYVIYCLFRELDADGDDFLKEEDIAKYDEGGLSDKIVKEIFKQKNLMDSPNGKMSYSDFVRFITAEEDKNERISIEYWFRCLDMEGDGILTYSVLKDFYLAQMSKVESIIQENRDFDDIYWQCFDMIRPASKKGFRLCDLKKSNFASYFINTFVNINKFMCQEEIYVEEYQNMSPWKRFIESNYNQLADEHAQVSHLTDSENNYS